MCLWLSSSWGSPGLWRPDFPSPWTCLLGSREPRPPLLLLLTPWAPTLPPAYFPQSSAPCRPHWDSQGKLAHNWCRTEHTPVLQPVSRTPGLKGRMAVFFWWAGEPSLESCRLPLPPSLWTTKHLKALLSPPQSHGILSSFLLSQTPPPFPSSQSLVLPYFLSVPTGGGEGFLAILVPMASSAQPLDSGVVTGKARKASPSFLV